MRASLPITFKNQMVTFPKYDTLPVNNEVTYSTMSKEEIDRLYPKTGSEVQKVKLTKEEYLKLKAEGMNNTNIAKRFGISDATLYYYLKKWGLPKESEIKAEKVREEVLSQLGTEKGFVTIYDTPKETVKVSEIECVGPITADDKINSPSHYTAGGIEVIDYMQAKMTKEQFQGYLIGNIIKYTSRFQFKNGLEDLKKSQWYINKLIEVSE